MEIILNITGILYQVHIKTPSTQCHSHSQGFLKLDFMRVQNWTPVFDLMQTETSVIKHEIRRYPSIKNSINTKIFSCAKSTLPRKYWVHWHEERLLINLSLWGDRTKLDWERDLSIGDFRLSFIRTWEADDNTRLADQ